MNFISKKYNNYINHKNINNIKDKHLLLERLIHDILLITFITRKELEDYLDTRTLYLDTRSTVELQIDELLLLNKDKNKLKSITLYYNNLRNKNILKK